MSLNKYDPLTGTLTTLANGQRIWLGTKAAHDAAEAAGTLPTNCLIAITDDGDITGVVDEVEDGNMNPVTSNAVADITEYDTYQITLPAAWAYNGKSAILYFYKWGRIVTVIGNFAWTLSSIGQTSIVGSLPDKFKPVASIYQFLWNTNDRNEAVNVLNIGIGANGNVTCYGYGTAGTPMNISAQVLTYISAE